MRNIKIERTKKIPEKHSEFVWCGVCVKECVVPEGKQGKKNYEEFVLIKKRVFVCVCVCSRKVLLY